MSKPRIAAWLYKMTVRGDVLSFDQTDHYWAVPYSDKPHDYIQGQPLIRLADHEAAREADKVRIAELTEALVRCRHQASYMIGGGEALSNQLNKVREIANAALAQQGKEGET